MKRKEFITKDYFLQHDKRGITEVNALPTEEIDYLSFYRLLEDKGEYTKGVYFYDNGAWTKIESKVENMYITDINRLSDYLYKVDYDKLPPYAEIDTSTMGGCTSFIRDNKLYRSYDYNYDNTCEFLVRTNELTGMAYIPNLQSGHFDMKVINQLPYHIVDGVNKNGIMASVHILYNDFGHTSYTGADKLPASKAIYYILSTLTNINDITTLENLQKIELPQTLIDNEYTIQLLVSDGTTTYTIAPSSGTTMTITNITGYNGGIPRMTNFKIYKDGEVSLTDSNIQNRPNGVERYNMIGAGTTLKDLAFTKCYEDTSRLSEFVGMGGTTKTSTTAQLEAQYNISKAEYDNRRRDGKTWHSVHSIAYSNSGVVAELFAQEDYSKDFSGNVISNNENIVSVDTLPTESIDENILYYLTTDKTLYHYKNNEWLEVGSGGIEHSETFPTEYEDKKLFVLEKDIDTQNPKGLYIYHKGGGFKGTIKLKDNIDSAFGVLANDDSHTIFFPVDGKLCYGILKENRYISGSFHDVLVYRTNDGYSIDAYIEGQGWTNDNYRTLDLGEEEQEIDTILATFLSEASESGLTTGFELLANVGGGDSAVTSVNGETGDVVLDSKDIKMATPFDSQTIDTYMKGLEVSIFNKLDKRTDANSVYGTNASGAQVMYRESDLRVPVIDNLTSTDNTSALSAKQGKQLNDTKVTKSTITNRVYGTDSGGNQVMYSFGNIAEMIADSLPHLYRHIFGVMRSTSDATIYITFDILNTSETMTVEQAKTWLRDNGFTDKTKCYPATGLAASTNYYCASSSGASPTTQFANIQQINGIYSNGSTITYVYRTGTLVDIDNARLTLIKSLKVF